jgi:Ni,Fe-hydrogenase III large subunit
VSPVIPVGPYHPALEEPYKIELVCDGETITDSRITVGFNFRAIEWLAERKNYTQDLALVERVCGICSNVHTLTFSRALEQLAGVEVPERARHIRVVVHEAERLHSHLLWAGVACELMGFQTLFMTCFALREKVMDVLEAVSGNRVNYAMNKPGGVTRDIVDSAMVVAAAREIGRVTSEQLIPVLTTDRTVRARCAGVGVLTREQAQAWGVLGPVARASGLPQDIRRAAPYEIYDRLDFEVPVRTEGDVLARIVVRALEVVESCRIIEQALDGLPGGPIDCGDFIHIPAGEACARIEGPRGEVFYYVASDGSDVPTRVRIRTPTFQNMPTVALMVARQTLADAPLIQASIDPCYSCTDR